ncbi:MAG: (d)CMP kinase [Candidatus Omnitrophota bacterium]|jgi:cytidylate kinase
MIVAIDGPAGSGKTTIAKLLAKHLNISYLDTGATYRALTLKALKNNVDLKDVQALVKLAQHLNIEFKDKRTYLDGTDVSDKIRLPVIDKNISVIVSYPEVRSVMVDLQRILSKNTDFVVEGRDIATVVFPDARFKFYLDANPEVRAKRRFKELEEKGVKIDFKELEKDLYKRDDADKNRKVGALTISADAIVIDTSDLAIDGVVQKMTDYIKKK